MRTVRMRVTPREVAPHVEPVLDVTSVIALDELHDGPDGVLPRSRARLR
jgi:hypothetical protein